MRNTFAVNLPLRCHVWNWVIHRYRMFISPFCEFPLLLSTLIKLCLETQCSGAATGCRCPLGWCSNIVWLYHIYNHNVIIIWKLYFDIFRLKVLVVGKIYYELSMNSTVQRQLCSSPIPFTAKPTLIRKKFQKKSRKLTCDVKCMAKSLPPQCALRSGFITMLTEIILGKIIYKPIWLLGAFHSLLIPKCIFILFLKIKRNAAHIDFINGGIMHFRLCAV